MSESDRGTREEWGTERKVGSGTKNSWQEAAGSERSDECEIGRVGDRATGRDERRRAAERRTAGRWQEAAGSWQTAAEALMGRGERKIGILTMEYRLTREERW